MARRSKRTKSRSVTVDWSDADLRNYVNREGEYLFKVTSAEEEDGRIVMESEVISKVQEGRTLRTYFNLAPQSLWVLGQFMEATDQEIPEDEADIDLDEFIDKIFVGRVEEHEFDDKKYMRIKAFMHEDDFEGEMPKGGKKKDEEEEPDEEPDEKPAKRGRGRPRNEDKKKKKKLTQEEVQDMSEDELTELIEEHELDVDLDDFKTLRKKVNAVIDALTEADLIEEE